MTTPVILSKTLKSGKTTYGIVAVEKPNERVARVHVRRELNTPEGHRKVNRLAMWLLSEPNEPVDVRVKVVDSNDTSLLGLNDRDKAKIDDWLHQEQLRKPDDSGQVDLLIVADHEDKSVVIQFPIPIQYIKLPKESALQIIQRLQEELEELEKGPPHGDQADGSADPTGQHHPAD